MRQTTRAGRKIHQSHPADANTEATPNGPSQNRSDAAYRRFLQWAVVDLNH